MLQCFYQNETAGNVSRDLRYITRVNNFKTMLVEESAHFTNLPRVEFSVVIFLGRRQNILCYTNVGDVALFRVCIRHGGFYAFCDILWWNSCGLVWQSSAYFGSSLEGSGELTLR